MTPAILRAVLPLMRLLRACLPGFNITPDRGAHALLAAALHPQPLRPDLKYVLRAGRLEPGGAHVPCGAAWGEAAQDRMLAACEAWEARWREQEGAARAAGAAALPTLL